MPATLQLQQHTGRTGILARFSSRLTVARLTLALLIIGLAWRTVRYLLQFPIWGDEALLAINFVWFDYRELTQRLENIQIAPLLFLWGERAILGLFGAGEMALRLLPFLAGMASLALYWRLTGLMLGRRARLFAIGFLSVAIWPVSMSTLIKPYSFDLLMSLVLLVPAVEWLRSPEKSKWLICLAVVAPVAMLSSYTSAFVAGGISLALLLPVWREGWRARCWFAAYNLTMLVGFALSCYIGNRQLTTYDRDVSTQAGMTSMWSEGFPPSNPLAFLDWFVRSTTGQMAAYPLGASNGGSILTVLLALAGITYWARRGRWAWLTLFIAPLFLTLIASVMHRYPYGRSCRLQQHLAAGICILAGLGLWSLVAAISRRAVSRAKWTLAVAGLFALIGLGGLLRDVAQPYRDPGFVWMRDTMEDMRKLAPAPEHVVVCGGRHETEVVFEWYWASEGERVSWDYEIPPAALTTDRLWGFHYGPVGDGACERLTTELHRQNPAWRLVKRFPYEYRPRKGQPVSCELFGFARCP